MRRRIRSALLLTVVLALAACASDPAPDLDREFAAWRYEQEGYRADQLEELYRNERDRAEKLTRAILVLRREIQDLEEERAGLESRRDGMKSPAEE